ncbi:LLM class flavin-dependent oxidoreductase [Raineyella sp. W15-4]|uniref:LLM class flavin-dependent oxidoreductase n=1 Tax=Raineyella sp. W15-4 TaxID=3081651 RepID=UPI002954BE6F|nr:LLM class flavin-dependent oxidoreductase [Raineyella sp. W15-4]WOQ16107.1 LLM class flavin-dependent oxidoreductase [Raineyella sp. W15-4]
MTASRQLHLNAFLYYAGHHEAAWRHPSSGADRLTDLDYWTELATTAERGLLDAIFLADAPVYDDRQVRFSALHALEPISLLSALATATRRIGLVATASTTYTEPYNLARQLSTLDHLSKGRAGWNIVTTAWPQAAGHFGRPEHPDPARRYARATEYVEAITQLWDSWDDAAFRADRPSGVYADISHIRPADFSGAEVSVSGALNLPRSPQGRPVYVQAGSSTTGRDFAARFAEVIFTAQQDQQQALAFAADVRSRAAGFGRDGRDIKVLPGLSPYIGDTAAAAREVARELHSHINRRYGEAYIAEYAQVDPQALAALEPDDRVPVEIFAVQGDESDNTVSRRTVLRDWIRATSPTLLELLGFFAGARGHLVVTGTPVQVADVIEQWFTSGAADGFNIMPPVHPDGLTDFVDKVVPILQERGLFRTAYTGSTLREHYGLARPEVHWHRAVPAALAAPGE